MLQTTGKRKRKMPVESPEERWLVSSSQRMNANEH